MPKDRRVGSLSFERSRVSPYPCSSKGRDAKQCQQENPLDLGFGSVEDVKEWEDARCPICMEHPHNAVLLRCSAFEKGCRPFMCNTSYRHSNCLDLFCKSSVSSPSTAVLQEIPLGNMTSTSSGWRNPPHFYDHQAESGSDLQPKLVCPLCRGDVYGWSVVEPARQFMNSKVRSCSSETCDFNGTYSELRKHARSVHPLVRPTEVDPERQRDWTRLERERDYEDMLSSIQSVAREEVILGVPKMMVLGGDQGVGGLGMIESQLMVLGRIVVLYLIEHSLVTATILCQKIDFLVDIVAHRAFSDGGITIQHQIEFPKGDTKVHKLTEHVVAKVDCDGEHQDGPPMMGSDKSTLFKEFLLSQMEIKSWSLGFSTHVRFGSRK